MNEDSLKALEEVVFNMEKNLKVLSLILQVTKEEETLDFEIYPYENKVQQVQEDAFEKNKERKISIAQAKEGIEKILGGKHKRFFHRNGQEFIYDPDDSEISFIVNKKERKITALAYENYVESAQNPDAGASVICNYKDYFNVEIGKYLALCKLFKIKIDPSMHNCNPKEIEAGQIVRSQGTNNVFAVLSDPSGNRVKVALIKKVNPSINPNHNFGYCCEIRIEDLIILEDGLKFEEKIENSIFEINDYM